MRSWFRHNWKYLLFAAGGVWCIGSSVVIYDGPAWQLLTPVVGGFLLCQALYTKWLDDYSRWLKEAHEAHDHLHRLLDQLNRVWVTRRGL